MGLARAKYGVPPSSPAKVRIVASHPDNKIKTAMMEEERGSSSTTMVMADNVGRRGGRRPSHRRWRLEAVLPSSALPPSRDDGGLRGTQKPVTHHANAVANAAAPARCMVAGAIPSRTRKTKAEAERTTTTTTRTAWTTPASAISRPQGGFNNQQGREMAAEGSEVGADGSTMMRRWSRQMTTPGAAALAGSRSSSPPLPS